MAAHFRAAMLLLTLLFSGVTLTVQNRVEPQTNFKITPFVWENVWPDATVPYNMDVGYLTPKDMEIIHSAMELIEGQTCVRFTSARPNDKFYLHFTDGPSCSSLVGRRLYIHNQDITLPFWCLNIRNVVHELMHALGFGHEQSRPDRENYIDIHWDNINPKWWHAFHEDADGNYLLRYAVPYDYRSILHYSPSDFIRGIGEGSSITSKSPVFKLRRTMDLSPLDIIKINLLYNCRDELNQLRDHCTDYFPECNMIETRDCDRKLYSFSCRRRCGLCHIWMF